MRIASGVLATAALIALASCGNDPRNGLYVQVTGVAIGSGVSVEVIAADPGVMVHQRTSDEIGSDTTFVKVPYYVQRATTGEIVDATGRSSFTVLVEPDASLGLASVVPIVIERDAVGVVTAIGVLENAAAATGEAPAAAIALDSSEAQIVQIAMVDVLRTPGASTAAGALLTLRCAQPPSDSGYDWYDSNGRELRIVLPGGGPSDASARGFDLDCDLAPAPGDCDDLDPDIHPGAAVSCNGLDNDCSGTPAEYVTTCTTTNDCADGRQLCDEASRTLEPCVSPTCDTTSFESCDASVMSDGPGVALCVPTSGPIEVPACDNGCELQVVDATNGFDAEVSTDDASFSSDITVNTGDTVTMSLTSSADIGSDHTTTVDFVVFDATTGAPSYFGITVDVSSSNGCTDGSLDNPDLLCLPANKPGN